MTLKGFDMTLFRTLLAATLALGVAVPAMAATVSESEFGEFSSDFGAPTVIGNGATTVTGLWGKGDYDILAFTGLKTGAQSVTLSFSPLAPIGPKDNSFSAGGFVRYSTVPFKYSAWGEGTQLASVQVNKGRGNELFDTVLKLGDDFGGTLYLALFNTHGVLTYSIGLEGNAAPVAPPLATLPSTQVPAPVPLPAAAPLLIAGLGALAFAARRRRV